MPTISMFYGLLIRMFFHEDLLADWNLAVNGKRPFPIKGLDQ
jgi:hypothetical protein